VSHVIMREGCMSSCIALLQFHMPCQQTVAAWSELSLSVQASFRGLLKEGQLEDRTATFELPASASRVQPFDGMGGIAVHELISG